MRSKNADLFNQDGQAGDYDEDVNDESHPIRTGYRKALSWLGSLVPSGSSVLDLGSGTGNTILALPADCRVTAVDISDKMLTIAKSKLVSRAVEYVKSDLLECFNRQPVHHYDAIVSSYAIHHLTVIEKESLFSLIHSAIKPGGRAVFVDLMYRNADQRQKLMEKYRNNSDVYESFEEEFYWNLDLSTGKLTDLGSKVTTTQFSELSFGILAEGLL
jgi:cyclopropane fatty-acyl-phospholipid synthase-like methyltransferase